MPVCSRQRANCPVSKFPAPRSAGVPARRRQLRFQGPPIPRTASRCGGCPKAKGARPQPSGNMAPGPAGPRPGKLRPAVFDGSRGMHRQGRGVLSLRQVRRPITGYETELISDGALAFAAMQHRRSLVCSSLKPAHLNDELSGRPAEQIETLRRGNVVVEQAVVGPVCQLVDPGAQRPLVPEEGQLVWEMDVEVQIAGAASSY